MILQLQELTFFSIPQTPRTTIFPAASSSTMPDILSRKVMQFLKSTWKSDTTVVASRVRQS